MGVAHEEAIKQFRSLMEEGEPQKLNFSFLFLVFFVWSLNC